MLSHEPRAGSLAFGCFEVNLATGEVFRNGRRLRLSGQPSQVLVILVQRVGQLVTREDLRLLLWPDETFVDFDHGLNNCINRIRDVLGDSAANPQFIETLPKQGYRFIAAVRAPDSRLNPDRDGENRRVIETPSQPGPRLVPPLQILKRAAGNGTQTASSEPRRQWLVFSLVILACVLLAGAAGIVAHLRHREPQEVQRSLTRLTFDEGLQTGATWSPDGRYIAYASDRGGKFDIWVQQISGGDPIQITKTPGQNWQPDWSPDGKFIAYRSEQDGGLYIIPALGGAGMQRKIAPFGYWPRWSPDSSRILFEAGGFFRKPFVVSLDGSSPREVLTDTAAHHNVLFSTWHPDGKRITSWVLDPGASSKSPIPNFWTQPVDGGPVVESRFPPELQKQAEALAVAPGIAEWRMDFRFAWAPSGKAIYFERTFRGARNIWRMTVDPATLQAITVQRLTTSPGLDAELSISPDGRRLAFTDERQQIRAWAIPFDASRGRVSGPGQPVTSSGIEAWGVNASKDDSALALWGNRGGVMGTWETALTKGREEPIMGSDSYVRDLPIWSPDGKHAAYVRGKADKSQVVLWSKENRREDPVSVWDPSLGAVCDWSPDGRSVLANGWNSGTNHSESWLIPVGSGLASPQRAISSPDYDLWQPHVSKDGRWILFLAVKMEPHRWESTLYVAPAAGGPWIQITDGKQWDDKPRWASDGRAIYWLSDHEGFINLWGIRFDPLTGRPQGTPFPITSFDNPRLMIPRHIPSIEIALTQDRLFVPLAQASGSIWLLDNVDK